MSREAARIEGIQRPDVLEKLIELGVDFQGYPAILQRVYEPIQGKNKTFRALAEQLIRRSLRGEFRVLGSQRDEQRSRGTFAPIGSGRAAGERIRLRLHAGEIGPAGSAGGRAHGRRDTRGGRSGRAEPRQSIPARDGECVVLRFARERRAHLTQGDRLAGEPFAQTAPRFLIVPVFGLGDRLAVEFEKQIRMARLQQVGRKILVAGDAGVGADVKVAEIAHAGGDASIVGPVETRVSAQPATGGAMAGLTRNSFVRMCGLLEPAGRDGLERRMTDRATSARLRRRDTKAFRDPFRARIEQDRKRLGVKILLAPGDVLAPLGSRAAVTTG